VKARKEELEMKDPGVKIRFENGQKDLISETYGPFEFLQATYDSLRISPDGDFMAEFVDGFWRLDPQYNDEREYSDFVIFAGCVEG
jgi:hypothetical protein